MTQVEAEVDEGALHDFDAPASRRFVRYEIAKLRSDIYERIGVSESQLWLKIALTMGVTVDLATLVQVIGV
ncbi:MAG: hypothetical protein ACKOYI_07195 [Actinomycetota bacterium]